MMKNSLKILGANLVLSFLPVVNVMAQSAVTVTTEDKLALKKIIDLVIEYSVKYSFQALGGLIVLVVGWMIANFVSKMFKNFLDKHHMDVTVSKFLASALKIVVVLFAGMMALGKFGIEIAPIIAGLSVVGVGVGLALQGTLSNYAAGISLIFTKPFKVGDIVEVVNEMGEVQDITLPRTIIKTVDGTMIYIPNKHIIGEIIHNFSELKRLDIKVGVSYQSDIEQCVNLIKGVVKSEPRISLVLEPKIGVFEFGDSSVNIYARVFCKQSDYWDTMFSVNKQILDVFKKNNIEIPFPQRDVHIVEKKS